MTSVPCNTERLLLDLTKLPRARRLHSVRFRRTTPGKASRLITPFIASKNDRILDPKHPAAKVPLSQFVHKQVPSFRDHSASSLLGIRAFPKALLEKNEFAWLQEDWPYKARGKSNYFVMDGGKSKDGNKAGGVDVSKGYGQVRVLGEAKRVNMSVLFVISKKLVHKDACVRTRIKNRIKSALSLLITRDVEVAPSAPNTSSEQDSSKQKTALVSARTDDGEKWIMQGKFAIIIRFLPTFHLISLHFLIRLGIHLLSETRCIPGSV